MGIKELAKTAIRFNKILKSGMEKIMTPRDISAILQKILFDNNLFYLDYQGDANSNFAEMWMQILQNAKVYSGYEIYLKISKGTTNAQFTGKPLQLVQYLNKVLAPKITAVVQKSQFKRGVQADTQVPFNGPYMSAK